MAQANDPQGRPLWSPPTPAAQNHPTTSIDNPNNIGRTHGCTHVGTFHCVGSTGVRGNVRGAPTRVAPVGCDPKPTYFAGMVANENHIDRMHRACAFFAHLLRMCFANDSAVVGALLKLKINSKYMFFKSFLDVA